MAQSHPTVHQATAWPAVSFPSLARLPPSPRGPGRVGLSLQRGALQAGPQCSPCSRAPVLGASRAWKEASQAAFLLPEDTEILHAPGTDNPHPQVSSHE